jgi:hypothetical protein
VTAARLRMHARGRRRLEEFLAASGNRHSQQAPASLRTPGSPNSTGILQFSEEDECVEGY